jgi:hypothetical protein
LLIPAGLVTYMVFLYANFNDPLAFLKAEGAWSRGFSLSLSFLTNVFIYDLFYVLIFLGFAAFSTLVLVYLIYSKIRISYIVYTLVQLLLVFSSSSLESLPRYVSVLFPIYVGFALVARNRVSNFSLQVFWYYL